MQYQANKEFGHNTTPERHVVLAHMKDDWNHRKQKARGRWSVYDTYWRELRVKHLLNHFWAEHGKRHRGSYAEIVFVGHGSFFSLLVGNPPECKSLNLVCKT